MSGNSESSQNDLLCRLKLSLDTIFDKETKSLDKIGEIVKLWDMNKPLPPGSCGRGVNPLSSGYLLLNQQEYFNSRIYDVRPSETLKRSDIKFTNVTPIIFSRDGDERVDDNNIIGYMTGDGLGIDVPLQENLRIWKVNAQITLDRSKLFNVKQDEYYLKNLVTARPYLLSTVFDSTNQKYVNKNINTYQLGSDGLFYHLREIPSPDYDDGSKLFKDKSVFGKYFVYRVEVYENNSGAMKAMIDGEKINKKATNGGVKLLQLT